MRTDLRQRLVAPITLGIAYFLVTAATLAATRFDGGVAFIWIATAILTARLTTLRPARWLPSLVACAIASVIATTLIGLGARAAVPLAIVNMSEAAIGALILHHSVGRRPVLDSPNWLIAFVVATGMIAPAIGAIGGGATVALIFGKSFMTNALHWYSGHALGTLAFMPIAMMVMRGEVTRLICAARRAKRIELALLLALVSGVSVVTFGQDELPLLFLPMLPIVLATFRGGPLSTAASIVIISLVGGYFTLTGHGPIALMDAAMGERMQFLQLYIAATMLTVLPANAELERRAELFHRLRESEARYRLVTDNSTDIVLNVDVHGKLRFVSPSIRQIAGQDPEALLGHSLVALVHPEDAANAIEAHRRALADPTGITINEYRASTAAGEQRWFETHSRAVIDDDGQVTGVVCAVRDITHRKAHEERLARAALTDPLTGLANRRAFCDELDQRLASGSGGCVALFDLDHFKHVNDTHGHAAGDEVLRRFATIARSSVREQDQVARIGGEEFAVVLPDATIEQARLVCDRLRLAISGARFHVDDHVIAVTVSGGVARYRGDENGDAVLRAADIALYRAKHAGRDQLALAA